MYSFNRSFLSFFVFCLVFSFFYSGEVRGDLFKGARVNESPLQDKIDLPPPFHFNGYTLSPLANFDIRARVLSKKNYSMGRESDLSPMDLALGWGPMSDSSVLAGIKISQSGRWYRWQTKNMPIPRRDIERHSANMHLIFAEKALERSMKRVKKDDIVNISGYLVRIDADDGWRWISSLSRDDTGNGACEIIFVRDAWIE